MFYSSFLNTGRPEPSSYLTPTAGVVIFRRSNYGATEFQVPYFGQESLPVPSLASGSTLPPGLELHLDSEPPVQTNHTSARIPSESTPASLLGPFEPLPVDTRIGR